MKKLNIAKTLGLLGVVGVFGIVVGGILAVKELNDQAFVVFQISIPLICAFWLKNLLERKELGKSIQENNLKLRTNIQKTDLYKQKKYSSIINATQRLNTHDPFQSQKYISPDPTLDNDLK